MLNHPSEQPKKTDTRTHEPSAGILYQLSIINYQLSISYHGDLLMVLAKDITENLEFSFSPPAPLLPLLPLLNSFP